MVVDAQRVNTVLYLLFSALWMWLFAVSGWGVPFFLFSFDLWGLATKTAPPPSLAYPSLCGSTRARAAACERVIWGDLRLFYHSVLCIHIFANNALPHPLPTN